MATASLLQIEQKRVVLSKWSARGSRRGRCCKIIGVPNLNLLQRKERRGGFRVRKVRNATEGINHVYGKVVLLPCTKLDNYRIWDLWERCSSFAQVKSTSYGQ